MNEKLWGARIVSVASVLGSGELSSERAAELTGLSADIRKEKLGIDRVRILGEYETPSSLGAAAVEELIKKSSVPRESIEFVIFVTQNPDYKLPTTACLLQHRCQLPTNILAFDINQGCSGYVIGLSQAYGIISTGMARRGLLVTCDAYSRVISQNDKDTFGLFGDAATASLIERCPRGEGLVAFRFGSDGSGSEHLIVRRGGAAFPLEVEGTRDNFLFMNGRAIYNFVTQNLPPDIQVFLSSNGLRIEEVDQWIFHQANLFMNTKLCAMLGIPQEKAPFDIRDTGNTVSSSIPLILKKFNILGPTAEERLIVLCGFGVGLSWASCLYKHKSQS